jgi:3'-phosphoadenosine 5'-phosphosulfate (PAPS) 3'-phosphatase
MKNIFIQDIIRFYLPHMKIAGDYSIQIRSRVHSQRPKHSKDSTLISEALTDADLSVQNYFEVVTLSKYNNIQFISEETARSINQKYFPSSTMFKILLDPINNTFYYQEGSGEHDIAITFVDGQKIVGAIIYIPDKKVFFLADQKNAYSLTAQELYDGLNWRVLKLRSNSNIIVTYKLPSKFKNKSLKMPFTLYNMDTDYSKDSTNFSLHDIFFGNIGGFFRNNSPGIDWGAIGYIVLKAGGVLVDYEEKPIGEYNLNGFRTSSLICASNNTLSKAIVEFIKPYSDKHDHK